MKPLEKRACSVTIEALRQKYKYIIGIDETGWGSICGPITVAATVFDQSFESRKIKDSKKYTSDRLREEAYTFVQKHALFTWVEHSDYQLDSPAINPGVVLEELMYRTILAVQKLYPHQSVVVIDGVRTLNDEEFPGIIVPQVAIPSADKLVTAVSAASVIAKVERDSVMRTLAKQVDPAYGWEKNKGYQTRDHEDAMRAHGVTPYHRRYVSSVQEFERKYGKESE